MDTNSGMMGELLETGQSTVKSAGDAAKQGLQSSISSTVSQVTGQDQGTNEAAAKAQAQQQKMSDNQATDFLKSLYGKSDKSTAPTPKPQHQGNIVQQAVGLKPKDPNSGKSPQENAEMASLRRELHAKTYYQPLVNPMRQKEEPVAEKLDREKQEERWKEAEKQKEKPGPLSNQKTGTGEKMVGVAG